MGSAELNGSILGGEEPMKIQQVSNGFILEGEGIFGSKEVFSTLDEVFERLLMHFEGRSESFGGSMYGKVRIDRKEKK